MPISLYLGQCGFPIFCTATTWAATMPEYIEPQSEPELRQSYLGGWRVVAAAWALAVLVVLLFGGVQALASRHSTPTDQQALAGAVIPRHASNCGGPGDFAATAPSCQVTGDFLERAEAEAEVGSAYGF
jgi:hypothetical protein